MCSIFLTFFLVEGTVTLPQASRLFQQGRTYTIACLITGEEFVAWRTPAGESITLASSDARRTVVVSSNNYALKIDDITAKDGGDYQCVGSQNSATFTANVDCKCFAKSELSQTDLSLPRVPKIKI